MNVRWKEWLVIACGLVVTLVLLRFSLEGDRTILLYAIGVVGLISLIIRANCPACLAFGLLAPFSLPVAMVKQVPTLALVLILCIVAIGLRSVVQRRGIPYMGRLNSLIMIFYLYLCIRYACDPVLPGYSIGISNDITGFRSWFDHLIGLIAILSMGFIVTSNEDVQNLFHWISMFSLMFVAVFIGLMFVPSKELSAILESMRIFVTSFDNGWRRFVFLPGMGIFLIMAAMLTSLFRTPLGLRVFFIAAGLIAVVAGGGRGSVLSLVVMISIIWMIEKRYWALIFMFASVMTLAVMANAMVGYGQGRIVTPLVRVMGAFSSKLSTEIGAMETMEWRYARWNRAIEDIKQNPWGGMGYGGVKDYFGMLSDIQETSPDLAVERDVATGSTHNGYIASARNLGIPITILFVVIILLRIHVHWRHARKRALSDVLTEAHKFLCSYLVVTLLIMTVGGEVTSPTIWVFVALSFIVERLDAELSATSGQALSKDGVAYVPALASPGG